MQKTTQTSLHDIYVEFERAEAARAAGNEGRARVCARRAAGMAALDFLNRHGIRPHSENAYDALQMLTEYAGLAPDLRQASIYLTLHVTEEFISPVDVDLIAEARKLCDCLKEHP